MKLSEAKAICPAFHPVAASGGIRCQHLGGREFCNLNVPDAEFFCILLKKVAEQNQGQGEMIFPFASPGSGSSSEPAGIGTETPAVAKMELDQAEVAAKAARAANAAKAAEVYEVACSRNGLTNKSIVDIEKRIRPASYSRFMQYISCPLCYKFHYVDKLPPERVPAWKLFGRAAHEAIAHYYKTGKTEVEFVTTGDKLMDAKILALMESYIAFYKGKELCDPAQLLIESELIFQFNNLAFKGYVDIFNKETNTITDHKFVSDLDSVSLRSIVHQLAVYFTAFPQAEEAVLNVIKKPELRLKKNEDESGLAERIKKDCTENPNKYFKRIKYHKREIEPNKYLWQLAYIDHLIQMSEESGQWPMNPRTCLILECDYDAVCKTIL